MRIGTSVVVAVAALLALASPAGSSVEGGSTWICRLTVKNRDLVAWRDFFGDIDRTRAGRERVVYDAVPLVLNSAGWQLGPEGVRRRGFSVDLGFTLTEDSTGNLGPLAGSISYVAEPFYGAALTSDDILAWAVATAASDSIEGFFKTNRTETRISGRVPLSFVLADSPDDSYDEQPDVIVVNTLLRLRGVRAY